MPVVVAAGVEDTPPASPADLVARLRNATALEPPVTTSGAAATRPLLTRLCDSRKDRVEREMLCSEDDEDLDGYAKRSAPQNNAALHTTNAVNAMNGYTNTERCVEDDTRTPRRAVTASNTRREFGIHRGRPSRCWRSRSATAIHVDDPADARGDDERHASAWSLAYVTPWTAPVVRLPRIRRRGCRPLQSGDTPIVSP